MKWPNLARVDSILKDPSPDSTTPLENLSSDSMSYITGVILPGPTLPYLTMNTLLDADPSSTSSLTALTHMFPHSGFQYRSTTYWADTSIVGKVLAPTTRSLAGWTGPALATTDLTRSQIARLRQRAPPLNHHISAPDALSMRARSDPLGPPAGAYPVGEYTLPLPEREYVVDSVRIEKLALRGVADDEAMGKDNGKEKGKGTMDVPKTYDAAVQFAIAGTSWPLRLVFDVPFVSAFPCVGGPHVLFFDYVYTPIRVDEVVSIRVWGGVKAASSSISSSHSSEDSAGKDGGLDSKPNGTTDGDMDEDTEDDDDTREKVLLVDACGVSDNEVLARAWCSHWGLGAIVADLGRTCLACAIREAYAACLNVVILVEPLRDGEEEGR